MESDLTKLSKEELIRHIETLYHNLDVTYKDKCYNYISKEKIKKLLDKYVGCYMKFYEKIQELLEEE